MLFKSKKIISFSLAIILTIASLPIFSAFEAHIVNVTATIDNPVLLNYPNGGEIFTIGEIYTIAWEADEPLLRLGNISSIDLYYSTDGGNSYPDENKITTIYPDSGIIADCYNWKVSNDPTDQGRIMVLVHYNGTDAPAQVDYSDENFDITYTTDGNTVALWHFNNNNDEEEEEGTAYDETANENNGTLNYGTGGSNTSYADMWTSGKYKNALSFDGTDDYVKVSDSDSLDITDEITIEAWIKADIWENPDAPIDVRNILDKGEHNSGKAYGLYSYNGKLHFRINKTSAADVSSDLPSLGEWHHIAGTYDGVKIKLYIDNVMTAEKNYSENISINDEPLYIGAGVNRDYYFDGVIDEVRISDIARDFNIDCENNGCNGKGDEGEDPPAPPTPPDPVPPGEGEVVINEIMWMGTSGDSNDEWIELRNTTNDEKILDNCKLIKKNGEEIADLTGLTILSESSNGYLVISRKSKEDSKINTDTQSILAYQALSNTELQISLLCNGILIDTAGDGGNPENMAGIKTDPKASMSRKYPPGDGTSAESWCTAETSVNWDSGTNEKGTPGAENSCPN